MATTIFFNSLKNIESLIQNHPILLKIPLIGTFITLRYALEVLQLLGASLLIKILGTINFVFGVILFIVCVGLWKGKKWSWTLTIILSFLGILGGFVETIKGYYFHIIFIIINLLIISYLIFNKDVKSVFS